jgi:hypothetical protein
MVMCDPRRQRPAKRRPVALSEAGRIPNESRRMFETLRSMNLPRTGVAERDRTFKTSSATTRWDEGLKRRSSGPTRHDILSNPSLRSRGMSLSRASGVDENVFESSALNAPRKLGNGEQAGG